LQIAHALFGDLVALDGSDGLRRFGQGRVGPGGAAGPLGPVAADGAVRRFLYGFGADGHDIQRGLRLLRLNAVCQNTENGARNQAAVGSAE